MLPLAAGITLVMAYVWMAWPGVMIARCIYGSQRSDWMAALMVGPVWGFALSSLVLLREDAGRRSDRVFEPNRTSIK